jgi:uncharacterized protein YyaL (SSP411 family)
MKRPRYAVVTYSLLALAIFGFVMESLRPHIPAQELNRLRFEKSEFLVMGSTSQVDWRPLEQAAFSEARRTGRPILMLIGVPWSNAAQTADRTIFSDPEVISFLNRYMICIRVDGQTDPRWIGAFLPLRRHSIPLLSGFQMWFLTPEGLLFDNAGEIGTTRPIDPDVFQESLIRARENLRAVREGDPTALVPGTYQAGDKAVLTRPALPRPFEAGALESEIRRQVVAGQGGLNQFGKVRVRPYVLSFLIRSGQVEVLRQFLDPLLRSPLPDWLDGGFFAAYDEQVKLSVDFDKSALVNAAAMAALAQAAVLADEPLYRNFAERTFDLLATTFAPNGLVVGAQVGDGGPQSRSPRYSFSPKQLREVLTPEERERARRDLGLRVETNRIMVVRLRNPRLAFEPDEQLHGILEKLRASRTVEPRYAGKRQMDIHGYVVARLLECARLWGDEERLLQADSLFSRLSWFVAGDDVKHTLESAVPDRPYLGDYLAYADASLQHFLATGRADSLQRGYRVLQRSKFLFQTGTPGVWQTALEDMGELGPRDVDVPEILDHSRESLVAQAIRLCATYGRLMRGSSGPDREAVLALLQSAQTTAAQFSGISANLSVDAAALFCSFMEVADGEHVLVVGPHAVEEASQLQRRLPHRTVAPAIGPVREDLQRRPAGFYIIGETRVEGPMTEDAAFARASRFLRFQP